ncbi:MAG: NAD-dependent deacylase [Pseudomonadota bacterium]
MNFAPDLLKTLAGAKRIVILAGAGLSKASGVPTFRDAQTGLWANFRPEDLATREAFERDPATVWRWYAWRRELVARAEPNAGHQAIAQWQKRANVTVVTQNVDGLLQRADGQAIEYHGNLFVNRCLQTHRVLSDDEWTHGEPPTCTATGAYVRPGVVWFGEAIPSDAMAAADEAAQSADVLLSVGTSSLVYPAAGLAEMALRAGAVLVEINPEPTPLSSLADHRLEGPAEQVLPALLQAI